MSPSATLNSRVDHLTTEERELLIGSSLSRRFSQLPLWLSHPANIGGFYGFLLGLALILPYAFGGENSEVWFVEWLFHTSLIMMACGIMGFASTILLSFSGRFPVAPPRFLLYPLPFIGLALLTIDRTGLINIPSTLVWLVLLVPGPVYVHLSWAPRWRLLCMVADGNNPFGHLKSWDEQEEEAEQAEDDDQELMDVVEAFESEE